MILPGQANNDGRRSKIRLTREPYLFINILLAGAIVCIMIYSAVFSPVTNNYPVICVHEYLTGIPCASCGLSHSFSLIIRGEFAEAYRWNVYGMQVFIFFTAQLLMRIAFSGYYIKYPANRRWLINIDSVGSVIVFAIAFYPFMRWIISMLAA